jgi:hypothetical protein
MRSFAAAALVFRQPDRDDGDFEQVAGRIDDLAEDRVEVERRGDGTAQARQRPEALGALVKIHASVLTG